PLSSQCRTYSTRQPACPLASGAYWDSSVFVQFALTKRFLRSGFGVPFFAFGISAQVKSAFGLLFDSPVHPPLQVAVILGRLQTLTLAVVMQHSILGRPVRQVLLIRLLLLFSQFFLGKRVSFPDLYKALPTGEVLAVE